ncbi:CinA family protein [Nitrosomonas sp. JL21]|uniref:nicotinamide-nucleotide amidohydrolase family protein n=1 Tax=Nitrosomonas sp. JL21 TaxID=153949 RepID=UPI0013684DA6|nr:CinA family protein [Nitrosomonas sp.]MCC7092209.1 CinA family protein [Nitrosomonas sp.]MXS77117.1 CinA family protein [Nitrosomonas sp. JL21]
MESHHLYDIASNVGIHLVESGLMLVTAESCTGGWLGQAVTAISGSSSWYDRGFITYSNAAKCEMLGVQSTTLEHYGAVSPQTAREMVLGALNRSHAQIGVSITGIAGPEGGTATKPVGTVCFAWAMKQGNVHQLTRLFPGDRDEIRSLAVATALQGILEILNDATPSIA